MINPAFPKRDAEPINTVVVAPTLEIDQQTRRISLLLPLNEIPVLSDGVLEKLTHAGFTAKAEFHITALDIKEGTIAASAFDDLSETGKTAAMSILVNAQATPWQVMLQNEYYFIEKQYDGEKGPRRSIIRVVECPNLESFYADLNLLVTDGAKFKVPPAHITIATQGSSRGIGLATIDDLQAFGTPFTIL